MIYELIGPLLEPAKLRWEGVVASLAALAILNLLLWRLFVFTILPSFCPREPKKLPYWIPYFGHAWSFFKDSHKLMAYGVYVIVPKSCSSLRVAMKSTFNLTLKFRKGLAKTREPFAIMVTGTRYYIITSPDDAGEFYTNVSTLSWDGFLNETLMGFGVNEARLDVLWKKPSTPSVVNPARKCLIHLTQDLYKQHLLPGPTFSTLIGKYQQAVSDLMTWERISSSYALATDSRTSKVSLYDFCSLTMIDATQMTLFDPILFAIDPGMTKNMRRFTDELWKLMYPSRLIDSKKVAAIREQC